MNTSVNVLDNVRFAVRTNTVEAFPPIATLFSATDTLHNVLTTDEAYALYRQLGRTTFIVGKAMAVTTLRLLIVVLMTIVAFAEVAIRKLCSERRTFIADGFTPYALLPSPLSASENDPPTPYIDEELSYVAAVCDDADYLSLFGFDVTADPFVDDDADVPHTFDSVIELFAEADAIADKWDDTDAEPDTTLSTVSERNEQIALWMRNATVKQMRRVAKEAQLVEYSQLRKRPLAEKLVSASVHYDDYVSLTL